MQKQTIRSVLLINDFRNSNYCIKKMFLKLFQQIFFNQNLLLIIISIVNINEISSHLIIHPQIILNLCYLSFNYYLFFYFFIAQKKVFLIALFEQSYFQVEIKLLILHQIHLFFHCNLS